MIPRHPVTADGHPVHIGDTVYVITQREADPVQKATVISVATEVISIAINHAGRFQHVTSYGVVPRVFRSERAAWFSITPAHQPAITDHFTIARKDLEGVLRDLHAKTPTRDSMDEAMKSVRTILMNLQANVTIRNPPEISHDREETTPAQTPTRPRPHPTRPPTRP